MSNNTKVDWTNFTEADSCLDLYGKTIRWGLDAEEYSDNTTFKAVALTDAFQLTANQLMAIDGGATGQESGTNARSAFRARIIGDNSPHSFLTDPCDPAYANNLTFVYQMITMHTLFISNDTTAMPITRGDIVLVKLSRSGQSYNLEYGIFEELLSVEDPSGEAGSHCASLIDLFGEIEHKPFPQSGAPGVQQSPASVGGTQSAQDPGTCSWSGGVKRLSTVWQSTEFPQYNGKQLYNGSLEDSGMLLKDARGPELVPPAMEDFLKLAAAYEAKFPGKTLKGSGYRSYAGQVHQRMLRASCKTCCDQPKATSMGAAATPGRSNHGWGAAVDLDRGEWTKGKGNRSPEFRWLNKFSTNFNFVFGVGGEHWHLDWMKFGAQTGGAIKTSQKAWTSAGKNDTSITLV